MLVETIPTTINPHAPTPLYYQVFSLLEEAIRKGDIELGTVLPGEQELTSVFGVSRITIKRALNELAASGLVSRHRGRGTVVTHKPGIPVVKGSFDNLMDALRDMGLRTKVELLSIKQVAATAEVGEWLALPSGVPVKEVRRVRKLEGDPFSYLLAHLPMDVAASFDPEELGTRPLLELMESAGLRAESAEQWITAVAADPTIALALGVASGSPLMKIVRVMKDPDGTPIEVMQGYYPPERFQYHMRLNRQKRGGRVEWR